MRAPNDALPFIFRGDEMLVREDAEELFPKLPEVGEPENGEPENGEPENGEPENGEPENGEPENGEPENGEPENGEPENGIGAGFRQEIGTLGGRVCLAVEASSDFEAPDGTVFRNLLELSASLGGDEFSMAGRAKQIVAWNQETRFCGRCGAEPERVERFEKKCPRCGMLFHPRISPAMIVRVRRGEEILLARSPGFPPGVFSVLAGFVEPGESIEDTVRREVFEEVGIQVQNIRYFGNQPWPFPNSLMLGFTADYAAGEIEIDENEIEAAGWFSATDLPPLPPRLSIARTMIEAYIESFEDESFEELSG